MSRVPSKVGLPIAQNYNNLRRDCIRKGTLFTDPYFPIDKQSLFNNGRDIPFTPEWKRPKDISSRPELFFCGASETDVIEGEYGNIGLTAVMAVITRGIMQVIPDPELQTFDKGYAGIFKFHFCVFGEWVTIVIDDRLPTYKGHLIFTRSSNRNEFWSALLEKAYAKLYGSYDAISNCDRGDVLRHMTGRSVESINTAKSDASFFDGIRRHKHTFILCTTKDDVSDTTGLIKGHQYLVNSWHTIAEGLYENKTLFVMRAFNNQKEWNGDWSDHSNMWKYVSGTERLTMLDRSSRNVGEFWMSIDDLMKHFADIDICNSVDAHDDNENDNWDMIIFSGQWSGDTAGGDPRSSDFLKNPQFAVDLTEDADGDGKCTVMVALLQISTKLATGYYIYKATSATQTTITARDIAQTSSYNSGKFLFTKEVVKTFKLDPGRYIIIPCTTSPGEEGEFILRVFTESQLKKEVKDDKDSPLYKFFEKYSGANGELEAENLHDLLSTYLNKKATNKPLLSLQTCRALIMMCDVSSPSEDKYAGVLNFKEFTALFLLVKSWKELFVKYNKDKSDFLEKTEMVDVLRFKGYPYSQEVIDFLFNRFASRRKYIRINEFVSCMCHLKSRADAYERIVKLKGKFEISKYELFLLI